MNDENRYKLNIHAHTRFSDGHTTIYEMAKAYKDHGFTCAVISDHFYSSADLERYTMKKEDFLKAIQDAEEAEQKLGFPVIVGMEYDFFRCEEVLCFGREFLLRLYEGVDSIDTFRKFRKDYESACVLCHPELKEGDDGFIGINGHSCIEGYEYFNGNHYFNYCVNKYPRAVPAEFADLTAFSNSDAHSVSGLLCGYNLIDEPITNESRLIGYIVKKKPVKPIAFGRNAYTLGEK